MSLTRMCDLCGREITDDQSFISVDAVGFGSATVSSGWLAHFHTGYAVDCFERFDDLLNLMRAQAGNLAAIPVARQGEIDRIRDSHTASAITEARERFLMLGVPKRSVPGLLQAGVLSLDDIRRLSDEALLSLPGVGKLTVEILRDQANCQGEQ